MKGILSMWVVRVSANPRR